MMGRNPVFALEMIQTWEDRDMVGFSRSLSQSSIRPGDDSDIFTKDGAYWRWSGRNPVFALEMIQTEDPEYLAARSAICRNPVFALEMIQTNWIKRAIMEKLKKVAIQYSPWR